MRHRQAEAALLVDPSDIRFPCRSSLAAPLPFLALQLGAGRETHAGVRIAPLRGVKTDGLVTHEEAARALGQQLGRVESLRAVLNGPEMSYESRPKRSQFRRSICTTYE